MTVDDLLRDLDQEISILQSPGFSVDVTETSSAPTDSDPSLTFEDFDRTSKKVKVVETCALYVDIRRSTKLNLDHHKETMAKLYSSFIRGMIRATEQFNGKVRNVAGDRIMVVFDCANCFEDSVNTAALMNTVSQQIINRRFDHDDFKCGIGIDYGKMMVVKCGTIKYRRENSNYKSLVWLGKPANVASKLTDAANQPSTSVPKDGLQVGFCYPATGQWSWRFQTTQEFIDSLEFTRTPNMRYKNQFFYTCFAGTEYTANYDSTPPILVTATVYEGLKRTNPDHYSIKNRQQWRKVCRKIPGCPVPVYGANLILGGGKWKID